MEPFSLRMESTYLKPYLEFNLRPSRTSNIWSWIFRQSEKIWTNRWNVHARINSSLAKSYVCMEFLPFIKIILFWKVSSINSTNFCWCIESILGEINDLGFYGLPTPAGQGQCGFNRGRCQNFATPFVSELDHLRSKPHSLAWVGGP